MPTNDLDVAVHALTILFGMGQCASVVGLFWAMYQHGRAPAPAPASTPAASARIAAARITLRKLHIYWIFALVCVFSCMSLLMYRHKDALLIGSLLGAASMPIVAITHRHYGIPVTPIITLSLGLLQALAWGLYIAGDAPYIGMLARAAYLLATHHLAPNSADRELLDFDLAVQIGASCAAFMPSSGHMLFGTILSYFAMLPMATAITCWLDARLRKPASHWCYLALAGGLGLIAFMGVAAQIAALGMPS